VVSREPTALSATLLKEPEEDMIETAAAKRQEATHIKVVDS
jgi:hypothetical protein